MFFMYFSRSFDEMITDFDEMITAFALQNRNFARANLLSAT